jgi:hypothetical protein
MQHTRAPGRWRRSVKRLAALAAVLVPLGAVSVVVAQPAQAAVCNTNAHVYLTSVYPYSYRFEDQPVDGGTDDYQMFAGDFTSFRVGGNGLRPYTSAFWTVESNVSGQFIFNSRVAGGNCVANETYVNLPRHTVGGEVWTVRANYLTGNSGRFVQNQAHFRIFFVDPPPPDPWYGQPCYYAEACF